MSHIADAVTETQVVVIVETLLMQRLDLLPQFFLLIYGTTSAGPLLSQDLVTGI